MKGEESMAFESLSDRLNGVFKRLRGKGKLSEADIKAAMREVRMALLEADVNFKVVKNFISRVSETPESYNSMPVSRRSRSMGLGSFPRTDAPNTRI